MKFEKQEIEKIKSTLEYNQVALRLKERRNAEDLTRRDVLRCYIAAGISILLWGVCAGVIYNSNLTAKMLVWIVMGALIYSASSAMGLFDIDYYPRFAKLYGRLIDPKNDFTVKFKRTDRLEFFIPSEGGAIEFIRQTQSPSIDVRWMDFIECQVCIGNMLYVDQHIDLIVFVSSKRHKHGYYIQVMEALPFTYTVTNVHASSVHDSYQTAVDMLYANKFDILFPRSFAFQPFFTVFADIMNTFAERQKYADRLQRGVVPPQKTMKGEEEPTGAPVG